MATERQKYGRSAAAGGAGQGALAGAGLATGLYSASVISGGALAPIALAVGAGMGLASWLGATKEYDAQKALKKKQKEAETMALQEQSAQRRQQAAEVDKARRRGEMFNYEEGDEIMAASLGSGSTYDQFMNRQYGG